MKIIHNNIVNVFQLPLEIKMQPPSENNSKAQPASAEYFNVLAISITQILEQG